MGLTQSKLAEMEQRTQSGSLLYNNMRLGLSLYCIYKIMKLANHISLKQSIRINSFIN